MKELKQTVLDRKINIFRKWAAEKESVISNRTEIAQEAIIIIEELLLKIEESQQAFQESYLITKE